MLSNEQKKASLFLSSIYVTINQILQQNTSISKAYKALKALKAPESLYLATEFNLSLRILKRERDWIFSVRLEAY